MPTFCRHNRFLERCPICSKTLPGRSPSARRARGAGPAKAGPGPTAARGGALGGKAVRVQREGRAEDDGYRSELVPGLRASTDASRLAEEIAFSSARLLALETAPPDLYGELRALGASELERATWTCFLIAYLSPLEDRDPFAGIRLALAAMPFLATASSDATPPWSGETVDLREIPLGPRTSHESARGAETLLAYRQWVRRAGGTQAAALTGDRTWGPQRRFERLFERLALPRFARAARYDLLVTLGRLGLYELCPDSLHLAGVPGLSVEDLTTLGAKRVFGIGDPLLLERRAAALAEAARVPVETLDLALANWASPRPASVGVPRDTHDGEARERAGEALGL